jgi:tetratricopeptide (TPR) repeat protein
MNAFPSIRPFAKALVFAAGVTFIANSMSAQTSPAQIPSNRTADQIPDTSTRSRLDHAHALELSGRLDTAAQNWQQVLLVEPNNTEALAGLARSARLSGNPALAKVYLDRLRATNPDASSLAPTEDVSLRAVKANPASAAAWRDLFISQSNAGKITEALNTERRLPPAVHTNLMHDPEFLSALASAYSAAGRYTDAQQVLRTALELPFPPEARALQTQIQVQYATLLLQANQLDQAAGLFNQALAADLSNAAAWQGHIRIQHALEEDPQALQSLQAMPPATYDIAMRDPAFQITVASIYRTQNKLDLAQDLLEKSIAHQQATGQKASTTVLLELASIYVARNDVRHALPIYREILTEDPDYPDAWKGLLTVLHTSGHDQVALEQSQQIPAAVRHQLEDDPEYLQTLATLYSALGQPREAAVDAQRALQHYTTTHTIPPAGTEVLDTSLFFDAGDDTDLYRQLTHLGTRSDLNDDQHHIIQTIWAKWAVRRANQSAASGNVKRSFAILDAASRSFPENPGVQRALASAYASAGLPKNAVAIFKLQNMTAATASDYHAAIGAALAADDLRIAQTWLHCALEEYPKDAEVLHLAAKFEQARGNTNRAVDYYRASLAALPPNDPGIELVTELSEHQSITGLPNAHPQDLVTLLGTPDSTPVRSNVVASSTGPAKPTLTNDRSAFNNANPQSSATLVQSSYSASSNPTPSDTANSNPHTPPTPQPESSQPLTTQPQEIYGPYVPYVPPTQARGPSPVSAQLADTIPTNLSLQPEVVDVQPRASYIPNAQNVQIARTVDHPLFSTAPQDQGSDVTLTTQNVLYSPQIQYPQTSGLTYGQQYPQPEGTGNSKTLQRRPLQSKTSTRTRTSTPNSATSSSASASNPNPPKPSVDFGTTIIINNNVNPPEHQDGSPKSDDPEANGVSPALGFHDPDVPAGQPPLLQRANTERELNALEASFSNWLGGTGYARYRSGTPGFDRLTDLESPLEASAVLSKTVRATIVVGPVFLNNGEINNTHFQSSSGTIPVLGTLPGNVLLAPPPQFASGVGGELQLASTNFALALGYTPYDFLAGNVVGRGQWRTLGGHLTFYGDRDSVKDTQLSYAGMRDPGSATPFSAGNIWGGVVSTGGGVRLDITTSKAALYVSGGGAELTGTHVLENHRYNGQMGAYFNVHRWPGHGSLKIGGDFFAMHYDYNEQSMTYGQGGYFSPNVYFLASVPITYTGYYKNNFHYSITGAAGVRSLQENKAPYYPIDLPLETDSGNAFTPTVSSTALNYALNSQGSYHFNEHWFIGAFLSANNTNNYNNVAGGFFVRYLFKPQYPTDDYPTGFFPVAGTRALRVP